MFKNKKNINTKCTYKKTGLHKNKTCIQFSWLLILNKLTLVIIKNIKYNCPN